jgi:hypothetical protein
MTTLFELRSQQAALQSRYDGIFAELAPKAQAGKGRAKWTDESVAVWLKLPVDSVRGIIVENLAEFLVDDNCLAALLDVREILWLLDFKGPRASEISFVLSQMTAVSSFLADLDRDGSEP